MYYCWKVGHFEKNKIHNERIRKLILNEADRFFEQDFLNELVIIAKN